MKLIYSKSALKCNSFDGTIGIKIPFFRDSVTIEPGRSSLQFVTTNCLEKLITIKKRPVSIKKYRVAIKNKHLSIKKKLLPLTKNLLTIKKNLVAIQ